MDHCVSILLALNSDVGGFIRVCDGVGRDAIGAVWGRSQPMQMNGDSAAHGPPLWTPHPPKGGYPSHHPYIYIYYLSHTGSPLSLTSSNISIPSSPITAKQGVSTPK